MKQALLTMKILTNFIITIVIVGFIVWNRLIRERMPIELNILIAKSNNFYLIIISFLLLISSLLFLISIKNIFFINKKTNMISWLFQISPIKQLLNGVNKIINAPKELYEELSDKYDIFTKQIDLSGSYIVTYFDYPKTILTLFVYFPRIIVASTFIVDILYFQKFYYFYISLILLLLPLCSKAYLYMVFWQSKLMYEYSEFFLDLTPTPDGVIINLKRTPVRDKTIEWMIEKYDVLCDYWHIGTKLNNFISLIYLRDTIISPYINLYTSLCYIIGWSYILFLMV